MAICGARLAHRAPALAALAGSYLAACTFYAAMFRETPVGHPYTAGLNENVAAALRKIAWETVQSYYGKSR